MIARSPLSRPRRRIKGPSRPRCGRYRTVLGLLTPVLLVPACASSDPSVEPSPPSTSTTTSTPTTTTTGDDTLLVTDGPLELDRDVLLATPDGVARWRNGRTEPIHAGDGTVEAVAPDGSGGAVALIVDDQQLGNLWHIGGEGEPVLLRQQGGLALHDATSRNDQPAVVITSSPVDATEPTQLLDLLDLATASARTVARVGDATSGVQAVAATSDGFILSRLAEECSTIEAIDDAGESRPGPDLPERCGSDDRYGPVSADDADATIVVAAEDDTGSSLIVVGDGVDMHRLPESVGTVTGLDLAGGLVLVSSDTGIRVVDLGAATIADLDATATAAAFADPR